ncbi:MAG TPA: hypothetical protein PL155_02030 [Candidatus Omnitrophota bacterium]|nr:hypothetical protein [Candidatus Omnitrophota bacterium]HPD84733.1 hypothetical protein [Candidatus Omnitrophota bacterium]HRZ03591.1 hypothetical protein [Candidatus Omnitrophota bacterium]
MEKEIIPDYAVGEFYRYFAPRNVIENPEDRRNEQNLCIVFCKKVAPNVFDISKGVAMLKGEKDSFCEGVCTSVPSAKVIFVFKET